MTVYARENEFGGHSDVIFSAVQYSWTTCFEFRVLSLAYRICFGYANKQNALCQKSTLKSAPMSSISWIEPRILLDPRMDSIIFSCNGNCFQIVYLVNNVQCFRDILETNFSFLAASVVSLKKISLKSAKKCLESVSQIFNLRFLKNHAKMNSNLCININSFLAFAVFIYPQETLEKQRFFIFFQGV